MGDVDSGAVDPADSWASMQWNAAAPPRGVTTTWESFLDVLRADDDPRWGRSVCGDDEWDSAMAALASSSEVDPAIALVRRRGIHLAIVVRDIGEPETRYWAEHSQAMRRLPALDVLTTPSRRDLYIHELTGLARWAADR